jgi:hypothetical protein
VRSGGSGGRRTGAPSQGGSPPDVRSPASVADLGPVGPGWHGRGMAVRRRRNRHLGRPTCDFAADRGFSLSDPWCGPTVPGTTSGTYNDVVLHMVWRRCSTPVDAETPGREAESVRCPFCRYPDSRVVDSRERSDGDAIRRRRSCPECGRLHVELRADGGEQPVHGVGVGGAGRQLLKLVQGGQGVARAGAGADHVLAHGSPCRRRETAP